MRKFLLLFLLLFSNMMIAQHTMFDICPLKVGSEIPATTLTDDKGNEQALESLIDEKPAVLIFYRGAWCGYCTNHLAALNDAKDEIEQLGFQLIGITPDQSGKLQESQVKGESEIPVYSDSKAGTMKAFGLNWKVEDELFNKYKEQYQLDLEAWSGESHHLLPVPAVFIIKDGVVQFQYVNPNYNTRLKVETLLAVLKTI